MTLRREVITRADGKAARRRLAVEVFAVVAWIASVLVTAS